MREAHGEEEEERRKGRRREGVGKGVPMDSLSWHTLTVQFEVAIRTTTLNYAGEEVLIREPSRGC